MENNKVVDYYQHFIPRGRSIVPHNNLIKTIIVNSAYRDKVKYPNKYDFTLFLDDTFSDVMKLEIIKAYFNYNLPVINNSNNTLSLYINLEDETEILKDDAFIELDSFKVGMMDTYDKDKIIELFDDCINNYLTPKLKELLTKITYTNISNSGIVSVSIPTLKLNYDDKIDRFIIYKLNGNYNINCDHMNCYNQYDNTVINYILDEKSFGLFGLDSRVEKTVNSLVGYSNNPDITWENRWEEGKPTTIYESNPKNMFLKMLGFSTKYPFDCNKFIFDEFDTEVVHSEYLGTSVEYEGFKLITRAGDEFILKYDDGNPRLFLIKSPASNLDNKGELLAPPAWWNNNVSITYNGVATKGFFQDNSSGSTDNSRTPSSSNPTPSSFSPIFDTNTIADKVFYNSVLTYIDVLNKIIGDMRTQAPVPPIQTIFPERSILNYEYFNRQLPIEITLSSVHPPTTSNLNELINLNNNYVPTWTNNYPIAFESKGIMKLMTLNPYDNYKFATIYPHVKKIFINLGFDDIDYPGSCYKEYNGLFASMPRPLFPGGPIIDFLPLNPGTISLPSLSPTHDYQTIFKLNGKELTLGNSLTNSVLEVYTTHQLSKGNNILSGGANNEESSIVNLIKTKHPEYFQTSSITINRSSQEFLYNQIKSALVSNNNDLAINLKYTNTTTNTINDYTLKLNNMNNLVSKNISTNLTGIYDLSDSTSSNYINLGSPFVNPNDPNQGEIGGNINCDINFSYPVSKNPGLNNFKIEENKITICFSYYLNEILDREDEYFGSIEDSPTVELVNEIGINYGDPLNPVTPDYSYLTNNYITTYQSLLQNKHIDISYYKMEELCNNAVTPYDINTYNTYISAKNLLGECTPFNSYNDIRSQDPGSGTLTAGNPFLFHLENPVTSPWPTILPIYSISNDPSILTKTPSGTPPPPPPNGLLFNYYAYYRNIKNVGGGFYTYPSPVDIINYRDKKLEDLLGDTVNYKYKNTPQIKATYPFTNDLWYTKTEYDNMVLSTNFFIADLPNCLYPTDYLILDIEELNNKYSNNNNIQKHAFLEIPNNNSSLIYYESTNIGYSTKEFNPPIRRMDRLTIKIRDNNGNILQDSDTSKDYSLIMNIQELNNSSNTVVNN